MKSKSEILIVSLFGLALTLSGCHGARSKDSSKPSTARFDNGSPSTASKPSDVASDHSTDHSSDLAKVNSKLGKMSDQQGESQLAGETDNSELENSNITHLSGDQLLVKGYAIIVTQRYGKGEITDAKYVAEGLCRAKNMELATENPFGIETLQNYEAPSEQKGFMIINNIELINSEIEENNSQVRMVAKARLEKLSGQRADEVSSSGLKILTDTADSSCLKDSYWILNEVNCDSSKYFPTIQ